MRDQVGPHRIVRPARRTVPEGDLANDRHGVAHRATPMRRRRGVQGGVDGVQWSQQPPDGAPTRGHGILTLQPTQVHAAELGDRASLVAAQPDRRVELARIERPGPASIPAPDGRQRRRGGHRETAVASPAASISTRHAGCGPSCSQLVRQVPTGQMDVLQRRIGVPVSATVPATRLIRGREPRRGCSPAGWRRASRACAAVTPGNRARTVADHPPGAGFAGRISSGPVRRVSARPAWIELGHA